jgi:hypothetical protein
VGYSRRVATRIEAPEVIAAAGSKPKRIEELIGRANSGTDDVPKGEWVRYSMPGPEGAEYVAVCLPAFSPHTVHRDPA